MNVDLTTENLRKLCRICFNDGKYNIWEHKIPLQCNLVVGTEPSGSKDLEVTVPDMLEIYGGKWQHKVLRLSQNMHMICDNCLQELLPCYLFFRKLVSANNRVYKLYNEALLLEFEQERKMIEQNHKVEIEMQAAAQLPAQTKSDVNVEAEFIDINVKQPKNIELIKLPAVHGGYRNPRKELDYDEEFEQFTDFGTSKPAEQPNTRVGNMPESPQRSSNKRKILMKIPNLVLTGKVSHMLTNVQDPQDEENDNKTALPNTETSNGQKKRLKTQTENSLQHVPTLPTPADASLIVTQFITTPAEIATPQQNVTAANQQIMQQDEHALAGNNLHTMDYAAVAIKSANIGQLSEEYHKAVETAFGSAPNTPTVLQSNINYSTTVNTTKEDDVYLCKYCPNAFSASEYLIAHIRKSHACTLCTQTFEKTSDLQEHIKLHQVHKCVICDKLFSTNSNLRGHIKRLHGIILPPKISLLDYCTSEQAAANEINGTNDDGDVEIAIAVEQSLQANLLNVKNNTDAGALMPTYIDEFIECADEIKTTEVTAIANPNANYC